MDATHEVFNQPAPLAGYNVFDGNKALRDALKFNAPQLDTAALSQLGALLGSAEMQEHARLANVHTPQQLPKPPVATDADALGPMLRVPPFTLSSLRRAIEANGDEQIGRFRVEY